MCDRGPRKVGCTSNNSICTGLWVYFFVVVVKMAYRDGRQQTADHYHDARPAATMDPPWCPCGRGVAVAPIVFSRRMLAHLDIQEFLFESSLACAALAVRFELNSQAQQFGEGFVFGNLTIPRRYLSLFRQTSLQTGAASTDKQTGSLRTIASKFRTSTHAASSPLLNVPFGISPIGLVSPGLCEATHRYCAIQLTRARL